MQREVVLVVGPTGSGKTTYSKIFVSTLTRVIILDSSGFNEFNATQANSFDSFRDALVRRNAGGKGFFRVSYCPLESELSAVFESAALVNFSETANAYVNKSWLVLEEADLLPGPADLPEYDEAISRGRHYGINLLGISLYPAKLPPSLRRQATRIISFQATDPNDLKWFREVFGERAEELKSLEKFHFLEWTREGGAISHKKIILDKNKNGFIIETVAAAVPQPEET